MNLDTIKNIDNAMTKQLPVSYKDNLNTLIKKEEKK